MNFQTLIYRTLLLTFQFSFIALIFNTIDQSEILLRKIGVLLMIGFVAALYSQLLNFLTVSDVFVTRFVSIAILTGIILIVLHEFDPQFVINPYTFTAQKIEVITIDSFRLDTYGVVVLMSVLTGLLSAIMSKLNVIE